jgi:chromosome partitioning protein
MPVIALVGNKGGAGKTTLCVNLASALARMHDTVVLDADPQRSSLQWRDLIETDGAVAVVDAVDGLPAMVEHHRQQSHYVVIDCPPSVQSPQTRDALGRCDIALIPVQPSPLDLWATVHIEKEIETARTGNPSLQAWLVINQLEPRTRLSRLVRTALAELNIPSAETAIRRRVAYRNAVLEGKSVHELGSRGAEASNEIHELISEVVKP